jgi:hypothetical protein
MDGIRGAMCFAMSISVSRGVSGFRVVFLRNLPASAQGLIQRARNAGGTVRPSASCVRYELMHTTRLAHRLPFHV